MALCPFTAVEVAQFWAALRTRDKVAVRLVQDQLKRAGFDPGKIDGDPGPNTRGALDDAAARAFGFRLDRRSLRLHASQFFPGTWAKDLVVVHHTAGGTAASSLRSWNATSTRVGTAYLVERDGTVFEVMPPEAYAGHLGLNGAIQTRSVGVELCNWGWLNRTRDGRFAAWPRTEGGLPTRFLHPDDVAEIPWRGERYWERYPEPQVAAAVALARYLVVRFGIDPDVAPEIWDARDADYARFKRFKGVISHAHVRADKTDVSPAFPWDRLVEAVEGPR